MIPTYPDPHPTNEETATKTRGVLSEIAAERVRQIEAEGWSVTTDDAYIEGELARAAGAYALDAAGQKSGSLFWPFPVLRWNPSDPRRALIKAAALAVAEIERLDRLAAVSS